MPKKEPPLEIELPRPADERPPWSRVGIVGFGGFLLGIAWPQLLGVKIGPSVPDDGHPAAQASASAEAGQAPAPDAPAAPSASPEAPPNREIAVVGAGAIQACWDSKGKKLDDCGKLQFDPVAKPRLEALANCPSALGLEGKVSIGFDVNFQKKEVHVLPGKKRTLPASTVQGILQCAAKEFANVDLEEVPHQHRRYRLSYVTTFHPPGKQLAEDGAKSPEEGGTEAAGETTSESSASGTASVTWDTALVRKEPKDGEVVARLVRGTRVKLVGKQNDWYKVEAGQKSGWVYRGAVGL